MIATVIWLFNEYGVQAVAVLATGKGWVCSPCSYPGHPGTVEIATVDLDCDLPLARMIVADLKMFDAPGHDCLPSPICEVCGREAGTVDESIGNAVMAGMLGNE